ncbi:FAD:protein FMN transferase [Ulvibacter litoralis]|uniref:FAD:protein FMN transferase n=1 Tax=Ulvibacter litoralis TaxID=227084 RepID=A0A1G7GHU2_9FLAO|nr:FAD:protein FMN transferase [Ulvibacter litoralis]GHC56134.1 FAD:protein FMN transferase [Ulvibacter litoralis]SDE87653.1 thiamine biosynthesis lipoprotein [Ulvibacter litoralis]
MRALSFLAILLAFFSCTEENPQAKLLQGNAFGTTYSIQFYASENFNAERGIDSVIHAVNKSVSTYIPNSDISKINNGDTSVVVDEIFKEVFAISEEVHKNSHGYFDPTIGVLRNAYGFGDVKPLETIDAHVLDSLMDYVGFSKVSISEDGKVVKLHPQVYFDFNAVAKGYGIDCIGRYLETQGVTNYLIELGGEILSKGENTAKQKPWVVGIEAVDSNLENRSYQATITIQNKGMASSGNYRKFRVDSLTGKKYVHTLNPLTGSAEQSDVTSATVIAKTCGEADAYATTLMALGLEKSVAMLKDLPQVDAYITYNDGSNKEQVFMTEGFKRLMN